MSEAVESRSDVDVIVPVPDADAIKVTESEAVKDDVSVMSPAVELREMFWLEMLLKPVPSVEMES